MYYFAQELNFFQGSCYIYQSYHICFAKQVFYHLIIYHILLFWSTAVGAAVVSPKHRNKATCIFPTRSFSTREIFFYKHNTLIAISLIALIAHYILPAFFCGFLIKKTKLIHIHIYILLWVCLRDGH